MSAPSDPIEIRSIVIDLSPSVIHPRGWIDYRMLLDSKALDKPVCAGQNIILRVEGSYPADSPRGFANLLRDALSQTTPQSGIAWRLNDRARRGLFRRPGYSRDDVGMLTCMIEGVLWDIEKDLS
jgi:hypothetical protein